jgi:hypothetical protein
LIGMSNPDHEFAVRLRVMQIIAAALLCGLLTMSIIAIVLVSQNGGPLGDGNPDLPLVTIVIAIMFVSCLIARFVIVGPIVRSTVQRLAATQHSGDTAVGSDESALLVARHVTLIMSCALLEGAGLAAAIAYMVEGQGFALVLVLGAVIGLVAVFPTRAGTRNWLDRHLGLVAELRQLGASLDRL